MADSMLRLSRVSVAGRRGASDLQVALVLDMTLSPVVARAGHPATPWKLRAVAMLRLAS